MNILSSRKLWKYCPLENYENMHSRKLWKYTPDYFFNINAPNAIHRHNSWSLPHTLHSAWTTPVHDATNQQSHLFPVDSVSASGMTQFSVYLNVPFFTLQGGDWVLRSDLHFSCYQIQFSILRPKPEKYCESRLCPRIRYNSGSWSVSNSVFMYFKKQRRRIQRDSNNTHSLTRKDCG